MRKMKATKVAVGDVICGEEGDVEVYANDVLRRR